MKPFKDTNGREWRIVINVSAVRRVRDLLGIDIYKLVDDGMKSLAELISDPVNMTNVIYVLCKEQADSANVNDVAFGEAFSGDVLEDAATAFWEELVNFFPNERTRENLRRVTEKGKIVQSKLMERMEAKLESLDLDQAVNGLIDSFGKPQASLASTPDLALSAS